MGGLTVKSRGRPEVPNWSRGCTLFSRTRGDTTDVHGPLQRLSDGAGVPDPAGPEPESGRKAARAERTASATPNAPSPQTNGKAQRGVSGLFHRETEMKAT